MLRPTRALLIAALLLLTAVVWRSPVVASPATHASPETVDATPAQPDAATGQDTQAAPGEQETSVAAHGETHGETPGEEPVEGHGGAHGGGGGHGSSHAPNLVTLVAGLLQGRAPEPTPAASFLKRFQAPIFSALVSILLITVLGAVARRRTRDPGRLQVAVEMMFDGLYGLFRSVIGPAARTYTPYLGTLFLFILFNNLIGMVPFMFASTSVLNTTVALAICTFLYVQSIGIRKNGILGYLHHLAGSPRSGLEWGFVPLMFPLHVLGEFIKPLSLSLRLYGNIFGEETLIATFIMLGAGLLAWAHVTWVGLPIQFPFLFLGMLTSVIQALVFTLLSTVYIALMLPHDDHGHGEETHGH